MCLYPKLIRNGKYKPNKKNEGNVPRARDHRALYVPVACGKCIECMKQKARNWNVRLQEDIRNIKTPAYFITLTFSNEEYKKISKLITCKGYERDNQILKFAVRHFLENWRSKKGKSIRHWLISELGHNGTENIHAHGIIYTDEIDLIKSKWKYGFVFIGDYVNERTINYITKYINKVDFEHKFYKPIVLCSKGIGSNYLNRIDAKQNKFNDKQTKEYYRFQNGTKSALPNYYRNKLYNEDEREKLWMNLLDKHERFILGQKVSIKDNTDEYNGMLKYYRELNRRLGYGNSDKDIDRYQYENDLRDLNNIKRNK